LEQVAESVLPGEIEAEGTVGAEAISEIGSHLRGERADDFVGVDLGLAYARAYAFLDVRTIQDVPSGLAGAFWAIAGVDGGAGCVAAISDKLVDHSVLSIGKGGLTGFPVDF